MNLHFGREARQLQIVRLFQGLILAVLPFCHRLSKGLYWAVVLKAKRRLVEMPCLEFEVLI